MHKHYLVVRVTVVEQDENGLVITRLCDHQERCPLPGDQADDERRRREYCHWAYEGFNLARNGPLGLPE